jgi:hypothetical protein
MSGWQEELNQLRGRIEIGHGPPRPLAAMERERSLRSLLGRLPFPQLINFARAQLLGVVEKLGNHRSDAVWAHSTLLWLGDSWARGQVRKPEEPDWRVMQSFGPSLVVRAVRNIWRPMVEWRSRPEQARKEAEDAIFGRLMEEISSTWERANPELAHLEREAAAAKDSGAQRIAGLISEICIRSPLWIETEQRCWNELLDALEAELQRSAPEGATEP